MNTTLTLTTAPLTIVPICPTEPAGIRSPMLGIDDRFHTFSRIGAGGVCEVFQCFDQQRGHTVALKRLHPDRTSRKADWTRFLREANVLQKLNDTASPCVFDVFPERMFKPYFTMELIDGVDLCHVLRGLQHGDKLIERSFPLTRLAEIVCQTAQSLSLAHDSGFVHRDIKPENLMIANSGLVKIVDWGEVLCWENPAFDLQSDSEQHAQPSRESETDRRRNRRLTRPGQRPGTPLYMSPEQISDGESVDQRSDVFSLGAVLYDCLALTTLIRGRTRDEMFHFTLRGAYQRPTVAGKRCSVPAELERICLKATALDRRKRYQSMHDFQRDLSYFTNTPL